MTWSIGLHFGESFAEVAAVKDDQRISHRWYLPKLGLATGLESFFQLHSISEVSRCRVSTKLSAQIINKRIGSPPAFLTTAGFENWLEMSLPIATNYLTIYPRRSSSPTLRELTFGLSERTTADGQVEKEVQEDELEFLTAKLKMNNVTHIALGLLHSHRNSQNEKRAADYFRGQGFQVFTSYQSGEIDNEKARWWHAVLNAYLAPQFTEIFTTVNDYLDEKLSLRLPWEILSSEGAFELDKETHFLSSLHGNVEALKEYGDQHLLYCGLEDFVLIPAKSQEQEPLWQSEFGPVALKSPKYLRLPLQPTQSVGQNFWGCAGFLEAEAGYEPGPMCLGRGLTPTLLDVLVMQGQIEAVTGLSEHLRPKSSHRVMENLTAFSRQAQDIEEFDRSDIPKWLEETAAEKWFLSLHPWTEGKSLQVCGPLAASIFPLLKSKYDKVKLVKGDDTHLAQSLLKGIEAMQ